MVHAHRKVAFVAALACVPLSAYASPWIEWSMTPDLPGDVDNPGGTLSAWCAVHPDQTTFDRLEVRLTTPAGGVLQEWIVTDALELSIDWTVPGGYPDGIYRYEMNYHSVEQGLTVSLSEGYLVAGATTGVCAFKFEDLDGDGELEIEDGEALLPGWEICATGPQNVPCKLTDDDGVACWFFLTPGTYQFCETLQVGWQPTRSVCATAGVVASAIQKVEFGNQRTPLPTETSTWGRIKAAYR